MFLYDFNEYDVAFAVVQNQIGYDAVLIVHNSIYMQIIENREKKDTTPNCWNDDYSSKVLHWIIHDT